MSDIVAYYDETWFDYRALWLNTDNRAIHFGYWDDGAKNHGESLVAMNRLMADAVDVRRGDRVLDAGCGVGGTSMWLAETLDAEVVGITPVQGQVERANRYATERRLGDRATFRRDDYHATGFDDASFDVVWAQESLCHSHDKTLFAKETARVLRPGGRLVIAEYLRFSRPLPPNDERLIHRWLSGWAIPDIETRDELVAALEAAGFVDVEVRDLTHGVAPSLRRLYRVSMTLYPIARVLKALRFRSSVQHGNVVGAIDQWRSLRRKLWFYGLVTAVKPSDH
ncbi:MAG: methyltransferase domain-containing protein [Actinobacteria bacterium]|nr:methyltransferase domain-containing protein [Actinomycetota bacterium]